MRKRLKIVFLCLFALQGIGLCQTAIILAETFVLQSGKKIIGKVVEEKEESLLIEMKSGILLSVRKGLLRREPKDEESPAQGLGSKVKVIDARIESGIGHGGPSIGERRLMINFLNKVSRIDSNLKEILTNELVQNGREKGDQAEEKEQDIIGKRIAVIKEALMELQRVTPPQGGEDFYNVLDQFYRSMIKIEEAMLLSLHADGAKDGAEGVKKSVELAEEADRILNKLLNEYQIVDVADQEKMHKVRVEKQKMYEKNKEAYEAQMAEIKRNKIRQEKMRQRQDFLRYLNYY